MILRSLLFLTICSLCFEAGAQKRPPPASSPPPPPPPSKVGTGGAGSGTGFRVVTIPVYGDFKLGVEKADFETTSSEFKNLLETGVRNYPVTINSRFIAKRLFQLRFTSDLQELDSLPRDIIERFTSIYGKADSSDMSSREIPANSINDSTNKDPVTVMLIYMTWKFRYHSLNVLMTYQAKKNGKYYGSTELTFMGNSTYFALLKDLEEKEIH
ncbi:MAG: hypothetical protein IPQ08_13565 [Chitinophagaceae bacterium]|nr:hypothetical protein [Chitinophagaceae bacterium]